MSQVVSQEAIIRMLVEKGILTKEEFLGGESGLWGNGGSMSGKHKKGDLPPTANRAVVEKLKELYRQRHQKEFPLKPPKKGFPHPDKNATA